jgi:hypothetical protein
MRQSFIDSFPPWTADQLALALRDVPQVWPAQCFEGHHIFWCQSILHGQPKKVIKSKNSAPRNDKLKK